MQFHCYNCPFSDGAIFSAFPTKYKCSKTGVCHPAYYVCGKVKICYIDCDDNSGVEEDDE